MLKLRSLLLFLLIGGCVEPYEFVVKDNAPALVVEAHISDRSFNETLTYPSDGRYFTVKLSRTGDVTNRRPVPVSGAVVELEASTGEVYRYTENAAVKGIYELLDDFFKAKRGVAYKLRITGPDEDVYESAWESLPDTEAPPMGSIHFRESEIQIYTMESLDWLIRSFQGAQTNISLPENNTGKPLYYRWTFSPIWIYIAPLASVIDPGYKCWATDVNYLNRYELQKDLNGGYNRDLFFIRSIRNERIFEKFSALILQHNLTEDYYNFWREMQEQNEGSNLMDVPPFNLKTNFSSSTDAKRVSGYFGVVGEQARRWYFTRFELSYTVPNPLRDDCLVNYGGPPAPECTDCREYSFGLATTRKPVWWE